MPLAQARAAVGSDRLVGVSTHSRADIEAAEEADYLGVGTIFATPTKVDDVVGFELVRIAAEAARVPWFAIGGIDLGNVGTLAAAGAWGVAVVRAIRDAEDPEAAARTRRAAVDSSARRS
jgi:thiamine-phosphate pyrophosphorylase